MRPSPEVLGLAYADEEEFRLNEEEQGHTSIKPEN